MRRRLALFAGFFGSKATGVDAGRDVDDDDANVDADDNDALDGDSEDDRKIPVVSDEYELMLVCYRR